MHPGFSAIWAASVYFLLLIGCSGGGNTNHKAVVDFSKVETSVANKIQYVGKEEMAVLDESDLYIFLSMLAEGTDLIQNNFKNSQPYIGLKSRAVSSSQQTMKQTLPGKVKGSLHLEATEISPEQIQIKAIYLNYSEVEGIVMNGAIISTLFHNPSSSYIYKSIEEFGALHVDTPYSNEILSGTITQSRMQTSDNMTEDIHLVSHVTTPQDLLYKMDLVKEYDMPDNLVTHYHGKLYLSDKGYIDVSTPQAFSLSEDKKRKTGLLKLQGKDSHAEVVPALDKRVRITLVDESSALSKVHISQEGTFQPVQNSAPLIKQPTILPDGVNYFDTNMQTAISAYSDVTAHANIYDPDLDDFTVTYSWKVNDKVIPNEHNRTLSSDYYHQDDKVTLFITATDSNANRNSAHVSKYTKKVLPCSRGLYLLKSSDTWWLVGDKSSVKVDCRAHEDEDISTYQYRWTLKIRKDRDYVPVDDSLFMINPSGSFQTVLMAQPGLYQLSLEVSNANGTASANTYFTVYENRYVDRVEKNAIDYDLYLESSTSRFPLKLYDLNQDGKEDILFYASNGHPFSANKRYLFIEMRDDQGFEEQKYLLDYRDDEQSDEPVSTIKVANLNNDGLPDIILQTSPSYMDRDIVPKTLLFTQQSDHTFSRTKIIKGYQGTFTDIDSDHLTDLIYADRQSCDIKIISPITQAKVTSSIDLPCDSFGKDGDPLRVYMDDFDKDGKNDILLIHANSNESVHHLDFFYQEQKGVYKKGESVEVRVYSMYLKEFIAADINNDGYTDFVYANRLFLNRQNRTFRLQKKFNKNITDMIDINNDGYRDLLSMQTPYDSVVLIQQPQMRFTPEDFYHSKEYQDVGLFHPNCDIGNIDNDPQREIVCNSGTGIDFIELKQ